MPLCQLFMPGKSGPSSTMEMEASVQAFLILKSSVVLGRSKKGHLGSRMWVSSLAGIDSGKGDFVLSAPRPRLRHHARIQTAAASLSSSEHD